MSEKILAVADIGGTNGRFALFANTESGLKLIAKKWVSTAQLENTASITKEFLDWRYEHLAANSEKLFSHVCGKGSTKITSFAAMVIAVAGPVEEKKGCLTNACLTIDLEDADISCPARLVNDFEVQAWASLAPCGQNARLIAGPQKISHGTRAVIGAGTGLGAGMLLPDGAGWRAMPSEAGHVSFPFLGNDENDFHAFLCSRLGLGFARGDDTITGRGLEILHEYLSGEKITAKEVGERALQGPTPTLQWYARFYARACRNWMLTTLCNGGLWIAGGIAAKNPLVITSHFFVEELYNAPEDYLRSIPVRLIEDKDSGLWGGAWLAGYLAGNAI